MDYNIHPLFAYFTCKNTEQLYRESEFSKRWPLLVLGILAFIFTLAFFILDMRMAYHRIVDLAVYRFGFIGLCFALGVIFFLKPTYKKGDWAVILGFSGLVVSFSCIAYIYATDLNRVENPYLFALALYLGLAFLPLPFFKSIIVGLITCCGAVVLNFIILDSASLKLTSLIIMLTFGAALGSGFSYFINKTKRKSFLHQKTAEHANEELRDEISVRKKIQAELVNHQQNLELLVAKRTGDLHVSEKKYRTLVHAMPSIVLQIDRNGVVLDSNERADLFWNRGEIMGTSIRTVLADPVAADTFADAILKAFEEGTSIGIELLVSNKNNDIRVLAWNIAPIVNDEKSVTMVVAIGQDITELKKVQQTLIQAEKMMSLGGLAAGLAHELNNPLAGISQSLQVMRNRLSDQFSKNLENAERAGIDLKKMSVYVSLRGIDKLLDNAEESASRGSEIVRDMLEFAKQREGRKTSCNVNRLLDKTISIAAKDYNLKKKFDFRNIEVERNYQADISLIHADTNALQQVFFNILNNGAYALSKKFSGNGKSGKFTLRTAKINGIVRIEIEDNGPGMNPEVQQRIFEPFYTTKPNGEGTGLGMSVSYFIITEGHGGIMSVSSTPGEGSCFHIELPV